MGKKKASPEYITREAQHNCHCNDVKSSGAMEGAGAVAIFKRSVEKNNLIYSKYLGDGDTSSFKNVVDSQRYKDFGNEPVKLKCAGHTQKKLGTRLRHLVKSRKGTTNPIHGKNILTETIINSMQNCYGLAIRNNRNDLHDMKKAVGATLFYCTEMNDESSRHQFCPQVKDTWCKWQYDKLLKGLTHIRVIFPCQSGFMIF